MAVRSGGSVTTYYFTTPNVQHTPPFLPETNGIARRLFRHMNPQSYGVYVFKLTDGTYVQSEPTAENSNVSLPPYPLMPDQGTATDLISRAEYYTQAAGYVDDATAINPSVAVVYYGGRANPVSATEAAALEAYTAHGTGYSGNITTGP